MARHLHIHLHTRDAGAWNESDHPRAGNGEFGSGGTGQDSKVGISLKGDELGPSKDIKVLRQKALEHAQSFIGQSFTNKSTGHSVAVTQKGVKHTISGAGEGLLRTIPAIPDLLKKAKLVSREPDKTVDRNIVAVETYSAPLHVGSEKHTAVLKVKCYLDGRRYYDHGIVK